MNKEKIMENNVLGKNYDIIKFKDCIIQLNIDCMKNILLWTPFFY